MASEFSSSFINSSSVEKDIYKGKEKIKLAHMQCFAWRRLLSPFHWSFEAAVGKSPLTQDRDQCDIRATKDCLPSRGFRQVPIN